MLLVMALYAIAVDAEINCIHVETLNYWCCTLLSRGRRKVDDSTEFQFVS